MEKLTSFSTTVASLLVDNIDTDQIIPARFLKTTEKTGLGQHLFEDWRYEADGSPKPGFVLNQPAAKQARVLLAGSNFGSGSSREHAPWALMDYGFQAVIARSFADIFRNNALKNGLLPVILDADVHAQFVEEIEEIPLGQVTVDLLNQQVTLPSGRVVSFPIDGFSKTCLLNGKDEMGYLLGFQERILAFERERAAA
ncbi:MAG TPA: 3-isopropylmalate dehydratase small subunit [Anaerolineaceae bacterium]|jgi:3-isopropylmalate/(R)-2-methylmalate dehydratase small subunit